MCTFLTTQLLNASQLLTLVPNQRDSHLFLFWKENLLCCVCSEEVFGSLKQHFPSEFPRMLMIINVCLTLKLHPWVLKPNPLVSSNLIGAKGGNCFPVVCNAILLCIFYVAHGKVWATSCTWSYQMYERCFRKHPCLPSCSGANELLSSGMSHNLPEIPDWGSRPKDNL